MLRRFEKFMYDITEIDLYLHQITTSEMKRFGLKGTYITYFTKLRSFEDGLTASELGEKCGKDKADVSRDINVLEKEGYVSRVRLGKRMYRAKIMLTEKGHKLTEQLVGKAEQAVDIIGKDLQDDEREIFYKSLDKITENLKYLSKDGIPE